MEIAEEKNYLLKERQEKGEGKEESEEDDRLLPSDEGEESQVECRMIDKAGKPERCRNDRQMDGWKAR